MFSLNSDYEREIQMMRLKSMDTSGNAHFGESSLNPSICLLFRCFLAFTLFICGILFPQMNKTILPTELKEIPVYVSNGHNLDELKEFVDSMVN